MNAETEEHVREEQASTISEVFKTFETNPLKGKKIEQYYEGRASPINEIIEKLDKSESPLKFLFSGYRGSGKSTELNILSGSDKVMAKYFIVQFSIFEHLDIHDITYIDLLLTIGSEIYKKAFDNNIRISEDLCRDLLNWMNKITKTEITEERAGAEFGAALKGFFINLGSKIQTEAVTREEIRKNLKPKLRDLIEKINNLIYAVENDKGFKKSGKKILVIVDDLDKLERENAEKLFYEHSYSLTQPGCSIIYTIPISLIYSNKYTQIKLNFTDAYTLPNIRVFKSNGEKDEKGCNILKKIVEKRMNPKLISDEATDAAIKNSGGVLHHFIDLIGSASIKASMRNASKIHLEDVNSKIYDMRNDFDRMLKKEHYRVLEEIHKTKRADDGEIVLELFHNLSVLEYLNDERWCDVHPLIIPLLEKIKRKV
ncbi:MAG: hypothetical protein CVT89_01720 [Candidatus Altiarchaeales archaeon HGW-Altiarchaeales-2]|nr:MAG: hypothetical protein CVT89_01720 [Candidatus Altiarchaeales archaeon HGW-Altiarchaeales-2]